MNDEPKEMPLKVYSIEINGSEEDETILADTFEEALDLYCKAFDPGFLTVKEIKKRRGRKDMRFGKITESFMGYVTDLSYRIYYMGDVKKGVFS